MKTKQDHKNRLFMEPVVETTFLINESEKKNVEFNELKELETAVEVENALTVYNELIRILEQFEINTNNSIAWLVPVNTATSIFPEFISPQTRLSASAATALAVSFANSLIAVWENYQEKDKLPKKCFSFESFIDFIKSPVGAPVCSYTMLLCFKTLGDFAPQLPDNAAMLSLIGGLFAVSLINGVVTQIGSKSEVNPNLGITRRDIANGMITGITTAGFIAQIDRLLKMNLDPITYQSFGPYMLPIEVGFGLIYGVARVFIPALIKSLTAKMNDADLIDENQEALLMMNSIKTGWDNINKHVRFIGNLLYIGGLVIETAKILDKDFTIAVITAITAGPIMATSIDAIVSNCSSKQKFSNLVAGRTINSPIFGGAINNSDEYQTLEQNAGNESNSKLV